MIPGPVRFMPVAIGGHINVPSEVPGYFTISSSNNFCPEPQIPLIERAPSNCRRRSVRKPIEKNKKKYARPAPPRRRDAVSLKDRKGQEL